jgi:hypothetical protein
VQGAREKGGKIMATINEGNGKYKASIVEVCKRINAYKAQHANHVIKMLTNPYNRLVVKVYDESIGVMSGDDLIMVIEYLTDNTIGKVLELADEHTDGRFW